VRVEDASKHEDEQEWKLLDASKLPPTDAEIYSVEFAAPPRQPA
jgi:hypothetical protein